MKPTPELPLYLKIADELRASLLLLPEGAPFETEQALTDKYGVARGTIRQALNLLVQEGLLSRTQGRGSFRSSAKDQQYNLMLTQELTASIRKIGSNSSVRGLSITLVPATPAIADLLEIPHGTKIRKVIRTRILDGAPFAYCVGHLRTDMIPPFYKRDYKTTLGNMVRNEFKVHIEARRCDLAAVSADEMVAAALSVPVGTPVLKISIMCLGRDRVPMLSDVFYFPSSQSLHFEV